MAIAMSRNILLTIVATQIRSFLKYLKYKRFRSWDTRRGEDHPEPLAEDTKCNGVRRPKPKLRDGSANLVTVTTFRRRIIFRPQRRLRGELSAGCVP
jgi:hypothetical protein